MSFASSVLKALPRRPTDRAPVPGLAAHSVRTSTTEGDRAPSPRVDVDLLLVALDGVDLDVPWSPHMKAVELALLDAVFTIRTTYGSPTTGVRGWVAAYAEHVSSGDDLASLAEARELLHDLADAGRVTRQRVMGGALKVDAAAAAARALGEVSGEPRSAADLRALLPDRYVEARDAFASIEGLGVETFEYLLLLIGSPGRRATAAWQRFGGEALAREVAEQEARQLLLDVADRLSSEPARLVHAVWRHGKRA